MKYIVKKSVIELPETSGSISDTTNITNKTTNTYSARVIEEMTNIQKELMNPTLITPEWLTGNLSGYKGGYYKIGKLVILSIVVKTSKTGNVHVANIPTAKLFDNGQEGLATVNAGSAYDGTWAYCYNNWGKLTITTNSTSKWYQINGAYICQ
jgi:hypothetical protein